MYQIKIKGEAKTNYKNLFKLKGIDCQDDFAEYFDGDESYAQDIQSGYMKFIVENNKLMTITTYKSNRKLSDDELKNLADYTQGQWSDGIGEGFEQEPCMYDDDNEEVYISPWFHGQVLKIEQEIIS